MTGKFNFGLPAAEVTPEQGPTAPVIQTRVFECDYAYELPDGTEWFRRRRFRLEPPLPNKTKDIVYGWIPRKNWWSPHKRPGADELIYHLPDVVEAVRLGEPVWWTEGEKDADSLRVKGVVATSHHGGAGNIHYEQAEWFKDHTGLVVLLFDIDPDDDHGGNIGAYDLVRRVDLLLAVGVKPTQLRVGRARVGKDVSDHLNSGHTLDELVWVDDLAELREKALRTRRSSVRAYRGDDFPNGFDPHEWAARVLAKNKEAG